jgi:hypothetical protein
VALDGAHRCLKGLRRGDCIPKITSTLRLASGSTELSVLHSPLLGRGWPT